MSGVLKIWGAIHVGVYRLTRGRVGGRMMGNDVLLLTTTGAKTGLRRTSPVLYGGDGDRLVVIASKAGAPEDPAWYRNLRKDPSVEVEIGGDKHSYRARLATDEERPRLWAMMAKSYPSFDAYQKKTTRVIPVVILEPTSGTGSTEP
jgi:deazaflavin-dependent oxidoreductase (nitroreductase family)